MPKSPPLDKRLLFVYVIKTLPPPITGTTNQISQQTNNDKWTKIIGKGKAPQTQQTQFAP
jgi:hypothetical protein